MSGEAKPAEAGQEEVKADPVEELAKELGWNPEYEGEDAKTAADFIRASKDIQKTQKDHARALKKEIDDLRNGFGEFEKHLRTTHAAEVAKYKERLTELKAERKEAMREGDVAAVEKIEKQIEKAQSEKPVEPPKFNIPGQREIAEWVKTTDWYNPQSKNRNEEAVQFADGIYAENFMYDPKGNPVGMKLSAERLIKKIEREVKREFPELFEEAKQTATPKAPNVEGAGSRKPVSGKKTYKSISDLPEDMRQSAKRMVDMGYLTFEQYVKDAKAAGFLE